MRSQASKPLPKKGALSKTTLKASTITKQTKKLVSPKKIKKVTSKSNKDTKKSIKDDSGNSKDQGESSNADKYEGTGVLKMATPKIKPRNESPSKKIKKYVKEKKDTAKTLTNVTPKKIVSKKSLKPSKEVNVATKISGKKKNPKININYKRNTDSPKKNQAINIKSKPLKKVVALNLKNKCDSALKESCSMTKEDIPTEKNKESLNDIKNEFTQIHSKSQDDLNKDVTLPIQSTVNTTDIFPTMSSNTVAQTAIESSRTEIERPPKFFTSSRSPRTVDIDVKCLKNSKGNLSVSERFLSMKCETKIDDNKDKNCTNALICQGPEVDVYTFTEKVDSPKNILSDFRNPINKNVGRVRPIARVKGTVIDKRSETEKKKYSPHRPIEEVVKQLKANKKSEELKTSQTERIESQIDLDFKVVNDEKETEETPKQIVSKSYKMVARKSSITGKPFSPIKFFDTETNTTDKEVKAKSPTKKTQLKIKKNMKKTSLSDEDIDNSKFSLSKKSSQYTSSDESVSESNDDNDFKDTSESDTPKNKKNKNKKYKKITDSAKKPISKELKELSKDSTTDLKESMIKNEKPSKRRLKLLSMWSGPKKHRMASLNAIAKVHCLYENESRTHMELGLMKTIDRQFAPGPSKITVTKKKENKAKELEKQESTSESEYENKKEFKEESSDSSDENPPQRSLRGVPGIRSAGKYWDPKSSTSSSEDSELESKKKNNSTEKKKSPTKPLIKSDSDKPPTKMKKTTGVPVKKKRNRNEVVMDLKDMVVQKRMASLNATAILAASYEKRSPKSSKDDSTSDSCSDESFSQKSKNGVSSGVKSETKTEDIPKKELDESADNKQKVEVIVNQDTDVTITGVYATHHHEGFCTVSGMQYRISSTSHTQTTATANCEKEGCSRDDNAKYTPLSALSSMQPPAEHSHTHSHPAAELGGLTRRAAGCSSAFSAPSPSAHHEPGYYQPAGPLIKDNEERALARYHPTPHYHPPHPPVLQQYPPYYPAELCYSRYYRTPAPYHMPPPQPEQMVGVSTEPYSTQYYATPPCYQHSPQRIPYVEFRGCPCPLNACPKNVLIGPATGKAPTGSGPADISSALAPLGVPFRPKVRACTLDVAADTAHGSGKDPPLADVEPAAGADVRYPCSLPTLGGASPKREIYDVRDNLRIGSDMGRATEVLGPPSPARGSAGVCAPQPPPCAPRRPRLGKEMVRKSLVGEDTELLLAAPRQPIHHVEADDDVMAISPPACVPIDLSSSDERSTPLVDVKKENEGPTYSASRKIDVQALKEHNCSAAISDTIEDTGAAKAVKRRYSKPKLEIDMKDVHLEEGCKTNGIGEHVKLQKRRKVSSDQSDLTRSETVTKDTKKRTKAKRVTKSPSTEKKSTKRKLDNTVVSSAKKDFETDVISEDPRLTNVAAITDEPVVKKHKSALLLDNLIRKNSIDRPDIKGLNSDTELNPAELFLPLKDNATPNPKKALNNNIVKDKPFNGVRPNTIELLGKKLANKNMHKIEKVDSKIIHNSQTVLKSASPVSFITDNKVKDDYEPCLQDDLDITSDGMDYKLSDITKCESVKDKLSDISFVDKTNLVTEKLIKSTKVLKPKSIKSHSSKSIESDVTIDESQKLTADVNPAQRDEENKECNKKAIVGDKDKSEEQKSMKRCKLTEKTCEVKGKLLVSKKPVIKTDEASLVVEEACAGVSAGVARARAGRGRGAGRRGRRLLAPPAPPDAPRAHPRWSNGWDWDGEPYISKVYLNNDSRMDRWARCWSRMRHAGGDSVSRGDCVLLRASPARAQPFVARVARLWLNPDDGEMMVSLVWYYRPEHTEMGRQPTDAPDEVFASRHRDANSVACIEDKCYVLTFNEYCRYRKRLKASEEGITIPPSIVPPMPVSEVTPAVETNDTKLPPTVSPELVLFCRKIYDFRSKKIQVPNK